MYSHTSDQRSRRLTHASRINNLKDKVVSLISSQERESTVKLALCRATGRWREAVGAQRGYDEER
jgi:hypothetical protein